MTASTEWLLGLQKQGEDNIWRPALVAREEIETLRAALWKAERKLSAYVGVCAGDKELTEDILPSIRAALHGDKQTSLNETLENKS